MRKELFDELVAACNEAIEHERGNIKLESNTVTIPDDEIEISQLFFQKFSNLSQPNRKKVNQYIDELLQITG
ncbi:MAG: hypothetical protein FWB80_01035 [Defluviitaleaceae bacterium]|nr:hypothetical protein [Defluviitaleaceae bacterium]